MMMITTLVLMLYSNLVVSNFRRSTKANSFSVGFSEVERGEFEKVCSFILKQQGHEQ